ncbi:hypothetical protein ABZ330_21625 [Streptomyces sp. NPDC006172]|uniref:hypothetical protein n=1 Tax=Streptomyces sp. NPDC006172 TaxID=3154470 RepID=UPI0033F232F4
MKIYADPLYAETVPDGTFGGARPRRGSPREQQRVTSTAEGRRRLARLTAEITAASAARRARLAPTPITRSAPPAAA